MDVAAAAAGLKRVWGSRVRVIQCGMRVVIRNRERSRPIAYVTHARDHAGASLSSPLVRFPSLPAARRGPTCELDSVPARLAALATPSPSLPFFFTEPLPVSSGLHTRRATSATRA